MTRKGMIMRDRYHTAGSICRLLVPGEEAHRSVGLPRLAKRVESGIALLLFVFLFLAGRANAQTPSVTGVSPNFGAVGTTVTISGTGFGSTQGPDSSLTF